MEMLDWESKRRAINVFKYKRIGNLIGEVPYFIKIFFFSFPLKISIFYNKNKYFSCKVFHLPESGRSMQQKRKEGIKKLSTHTTKVNN